MESHQISEKNIVRVKSVYIPTHRKGIIEIQNLHWYFPSIKREIYPTENLNNYI